MSQLRVENSALLKRLTDINQKYSEASVDNRILKADVETLRAKVGFSCDLGKHFEIYLCSVEIKIHRIIFVCLPL